MLLLEYQYVNFIHIHVGRQGLAMRGRFYEQAEETGEACSNLWQILQTFSSIAPRCKELLSRTHTYTSPECQNELLTLMSLDIQNSIRNLIKKSRYYSIMIDETPDISNKEQVVICFR